MLAADGYNTGLVGKTHFYPPDDPIGCDIAHLTIDALLAYELVPRDAYVRFLQERGALAGQPEFGAEVERLRRMLLQWLAESEANRLHPTADNHYPVPRWGANV